jgi:hypothetical protein
MKENPNFYAVIPADVRYDPDLCPNAKLLYGEITALSNKSGYCYATNAYFADLYSVETRTVSRWVQQLAQKFYISIELTAENNQTVRHLKISNSMKNTQITRQKDRGGVDKKIVGGVTKLSGGVGQKDRTPHDKKIVQNITFNNTINNTIEEERNFSLFFNNLFFEIIEFFEPDHRTDIINEQKLQSIEILKELHQTYKFDTKTIKDVINFATQDNFWKNKLYSFTQLTKKSKNGKIMFENILAQMNSKKEKSAVEKINEMQLIF